MKNLLISLLLLGSLTASAQYPLPDTRVYGSLQVDGFFKNTFQGYSVLNDSLNLGVGNAPWVGTLTPVNYGYVMNGVGDFSGIGLKNHSAIIGHLTSTSPNMLIIDTSTVKINADKEFSAHLSQGDTVTSLVLKGTHSAIDQMFKLQSELPNKGATGFEAQISDGKMTAKMYATNHTGSTNLAVIEVDTTSIRIVTDDGATTTDFGSWGVAFPEKASDPPVKNGAIYYNTSSNVFRKCAGGSWADF